VEELSSEEQENREMDRIKMAMWFKIFI